jgi:hypothetical protein
MSKLVRNTSDPESRAFWEGVDRAAAGIKDAPSWMRAGITVNAQRHAQGCAAMHDTHSGQPPTRCSGLRSSTGEAPVSVYGISASRVG